jgi:hypothetical protein
MKSYQDRAAKPAKKNMMVLEDFAYSSDDTVSVVSDYENTWSQCVYDEVAVDRWLDTWRVEPRTLSLPRTNCVVEVPLKRTLAVNK